MLHFSDLAILTSYYTVLLALAVYGFHRMMMVYLYYRNRSNRPVAGTPLSPLPVVTVQLPVFNERYVVIDNQHRQIHAHLPQNEVGETFLPLEHEPQAPELRSLRQKVRQAGNRGQSPKNRSSLCTTARNSAGSQP